MQISIHSEIGRLKRVLLHRPGLELEQLTPLLLNRMLFDDIPYLTGARMEHDIFAQALREEGVEVTYLKDMMAECLKDKEVRQRFIQEFIAGGGPIGGYERQALGELFASIRDEEELVLKTMTGVTYRDAGIYARHPLAQLVEHDTRYLLDPIPNLYFTRDTCAVIGEGIAFSRMYAGARVRETIYTRYIFNHHPECPPDLLHWYQSGLPYSLEGGDVLCLGSGVLGVGLSQRTQPEAIEHLCREVMSDEKSGIKSVLVFDIPNVRAFMHLDTVFTQVDIDAFAIHPGIVNILRCYRVKLLDEELQVTPLDGSLDKILREELRLDKVRLIRCGGEDSIVSAREQWNDASNTLCVRPGTVIVYNRNTVTNQILKDHGIHVIEVPGSELGRGRGGPRCMSMPLLRETL